MATEPSPCKDEKNEDTAARCFQQIKQWPKIMELLGEDKVPAAQLCESFDTLSQILQQTSDSLPEYSSTALDIVQKILNIHISHIYHALNSNNDSSLIMSALNLLIAMVTYSQQAARDVLSTVNFQHGVFMAQVNRMDLKTEDDIRNCCIRLAMAFFVSGDNKLIKQFLTNKDFLKCFFKKLGHDRACNIKLILVTLTQYLVCNPAVTKTEKLHILNNYTLQQVAELYVWKGSSEAMHDPNIDEDLQVLEIRQLCHQFLLKVTCDLKHGINFLDNSLGLSGKNYNSVLLKFLLSLHNATKDELMLELVVQILHTCPDIVNQYLTQCKMSFQLRSSASWLDNMEVLEQIMSGQSMIPSALLHAKNVSTGYMVQLAMTNTIPTVLTPVLLSQAVKHSSLIVSCCILRIIRLILSRAHGKMEWLRQCGQTAVLSQYCQALTKSLPDVDSYVSLLQKTLDRSVDVDSSKQTTTTGQEAGFAGSEKTPAVTDVPDVKKEDLLTILFDVLCAYQLTLPLSFTQTTYDFSRLPHLICNTESPLITDAIEERAVTFLLAFPEGKLRGFREVRGEDTSTVLLLLKHLTRSSSKSDLHALKTKLLNKFFKETGLFAHTEWEIAVWLDTLTTFSQDESQQIVDVFYKSLTQAIRNPYPFNDKVIEAMKSSHASYQSGQGECMNNDDASMTDILTLIKHTTSFDLDGSDLITTLENQPMTEVLHTEPMPCSALMPSALQIFCQLENNTQSLFGQYVSLVALSILERQDNPMSVCLLLHHCVLVEGSDLQHNLYWQDFMKYYGYWLPHVFEKNFLYKKIKSSSMDRIAIKTKKDWRSVLRSSIMQSVELSVSDMELLLQCDQTELLSMTRLLLMYINTLHILKPKNFLAVLCSYIKMIENSLEHIEPKKDRENKHNTEEARNMTKDDTPSDIDSRHEASDEWWTDMAGLVLQHAVFRETFSHSARNFQYEKDRLQILDVITSFFLKCLRLFELHLPNDKLKSLLQPIFKESCQNYLNFVKLEMNAKKANTRQVKHEFRRVMELFEAICVYSKDLELIDATTILLQSLNSLEISDAYSGSKQYFRSSLCCLLEILAERQRALKLKHSTNAVISSEADVLSFSNISTLVELAHKFDCDQMVSVLSQFVESNHKLVSVFTKSSYIDWLNKPSQTISQLLCQLMKFGSAEQLHWFEVWCEESSTQELSSKKDILLPVVSTYCNHSSANKQTVTMMHGLYWTSLMDWIVNLRQNGDVDGDELKMALLSHLIMQSDGESLILLLRSLIKKGQDRHHVLCHRIQKEACKLAVQRLTKCCEYNLPGQKTPDVMNEVIAACLQNIVTLIKKNPENTSSIVIDHLLSTSAIIKAVGTKPLSLSPSLIQAWKSLVRNGLKICYQSTDMLQFLTRLVKMIYSNAKGVNQEVDAEINNPLPLPVLYQIVLSHSLFLPTLLEDCDGNMPTKESLVLLMLAIVELEPRCCQEAHYAVLVGAYNVTRNITDTTLMKLMQHYQKNQAVPSHYKLTAWGHAAVSQHQMQKALGKSLWQQPSVKEILKQLETDVLKDSALHFPLHCKLLAETPSDPSASQISSQLYDPCFLYPLFSHLLAPECVVDCHQFIDSNALFLTLAGLSSYDQEMRQAAYHIMASFLNHMEHARFRGRREVHYLLQCLRNSVCEPNLRIPCIVGVFVARAAQLMLTPEHFMYPTVLQYLLIKPQLQMNAIPLLARLFYSSSLKHDEERDWMMTLLQDGLRDCNDVILYNKNSVFTTLMACCQSRLASKQFQEVVVNILDKAFEVPETRKTLCQQLLPFLQAFVASQDSSCEAGPSERHSTVTSLIHKLQLHNSENSHMLRWVLAAMGIVHNR